MAVAPTIPVISEEEYLRTNYDPECEFIDGILISKAMPKTLHSRLQGLLVLLLMSQEKQLGIMVYPELRIRIRERVYRVPDLSVFVEPPNGEIPTNPPYITFEVLSETETLEEISAKVKDHHRMGVQTVMVANPHRKEVFVAGTDGLLHELGSPARIAVPLPNGSILDLNFDELFDGLSKQHC
jgi:Uma2 family endonuclease